MPLAAWDPIDLAGYVCSGASAGSDLLLLRLVVRVLLRRDVLVDRQRRDGCHATGERHGDACREAMRGVAIITERGTCEREVDEPGRGGCDGSS